MLYERMKLACGISKEMASPSGGSPSEWFGILGVAGLSKLFAATIAYPHEVKYPRRLLFSHELLQTKVPSLGFANRPQTTAPEW